MSSKMRALREGDFGRKALHASVITNETGRMFDMRPVLHPATGRFDSYALSIAPKVTYL